MVVLKVSINRHRIVGYYFRLPTEKDQFESGCLYKLDINNITIWIFFNINIVKKKNICHIFF